MTGTGFADQGHAVISYHIILMPTRCTQSPHQTSHRCLIAGANIRQPAAAAATRDAAWGQRYPTAAAASAAATACVPPGDSLDVPRSEGLVTGVLTGMGYS